MSDSERFLSRWSRRKREVFQESEPANPPAADKPADDDRASGKVSPRNASAPAEPTFDLASLPPIAPPRPTSAAFSPQACPPI
jgi:hypothetical protein